jgi:hypothetical protein
VNSTTASHKEMLYDEAPITEEASTSETSFNFQEQTSATSIIGPDGGGSKIL